MPLACSMALRVISYRSDRRASMACLATTSLAPRTSSAARSLVLRNARSPGSIMPPIRSCRRRSFFFKLKLSDLALLRYAFMSVSMLKSLFTDASTLKPIKFEKLALTCPWKRCANISIMFRRPRESSANLLSWKWLSSLSSISSLFDACAFSGFSSFSSTFCAASPFTSTFNSPFTNFTDGAGSPFGFSCSPEQSFFHFESSTFDSAPMLSPACFFFSSCIVRPIFVLRKMSIVIGTAVSAFRTSLISSCASSDSRAFSSAVR
mmetsp:Transcript_820/g.1824  ORF Transcript_820/g.1824 Transcript_820/m.1824 type:complete len:264 (-) Transcript_820:132-923(-)